MSVGLRVGKKHFELLEKLIEVLEKWIGVLEKWIKVLEKWIGVLEKWIDVLEEWIEVLEVAWLIRELGDRVWDRAIAFLLLSNVVAVFGCSFRLEGLAV